jgi:hypothetical protein
MAIGRPSAGIDAMPTLRANVDNEVAAEFRALARQRNVSVSTVVREALYEVARERFGLEVGPAQTAAAVQK